MGKLDDAIKFEEEIKKMASLVAEAQALRLDAAIMGLGTKIELEHKHPEQEKLFGHSVYTSEHMPEGEVLLMPRRERFPLKIEIDWEDRDSYRTTTEMFAGRLMSVGVWDTDRSLSDYVSLVDWPEIKLFNWPRYLALSLLVISLILIILLVAR